MSAPTWIRTADRLPREGSPIIVARGRYVTTCSLRRGWGRNVARVFWEGCSRVGLDYYDHWMPLPDPPETSPLGGPEAPAPPPRPDHLSLLPKLRPLPGYVLNPRGHVWKLDKAGEVDSCAFEYEEYEACRGHNGPQCTVCGYAFCEHCQDGPSEDCPGPVPPFTDRQAEAP